MSDKILKEDIRLMAPDEIENKSFEIIGELLAESPAGREHRAWDKDGTPSLERDIVYRCIHTTADIEFADTMRFSPGAVDIIQKLIREGADIVTDTNMALTGISKKKLASYGGEVRCFMADEDVAAEASKRGITRAYAAMEKAARIYGSELCKPAIFASGNAPTALISLHNLYKSGTYTPSFIIGVPVGFVNVASSKELIMSDDIPYIVNVGNKGGSPVAAAIINAVLKYMERT